MNIKRLFSIISLSLVFFVFLPNRANAASNFTTDYNIIYTINSKGITHADLNIILTNTSDKFYASSYQMQLGFQNINNIKSSDPQGNVKTTLNKTSDGSTINLTFNKKSIGIGEKIPFKLSFDTDSIAHHNGKIWEVDVPGIKNPNDYKTFTVQINPDSTFGKPSFIKPFYDNKDLKFNKQQLGKSGISIAFGNKQVYNFDLKYHLKNSNLFPLKTEIALPPDTNYQKVSINNINPKPSNVSIDNDGNWLAQYSLFPTQKLDVTVSGSVEISLNPKISNLSGTEFSKFTSPTQYWQSTDKKIVELASKLKSADAIYAFVAKTLKYDFTRVTQNKERLGGVGVLNNPTSAACREFTDLFITLSRAARIPAREVNGFAYTENSKERPVSLIQDVLHSWPEYYDKNRKSWIMVDPTWGSTTGGVDYFNVMDFDHLAFVVKGINDNYPIPAGGYKNLNSHNSKDVEISFKSASLDNTQQVDIKNSFPDKQIAGIPISAKIKILNNGPEAISPQLMYVSSKDLTPSDLGFQVPRIPPFGFIDNKVSFEKFGFLTNKVLLFKIRYAGKTSEQKTKIVPFFLFPWN
ncbi:MAG TPA: transglutaminase family protein [Candidatus Saccharimonadales bacterium]|nr:transglutaminase family protein [Candidatus Saccharimonadales bacterium]